MTTPIDKITSYLDAVKKRGANALPGPWTWKKGYGQNSEEYPYCTLISEWMAAGCDWPSDAEVISSCDGCRDLGKEGDVIFIAHSKTDVPKLERALRIAVESNQLGWKTIEAIAKEIS